VALGAAISLALVVGMTAAGADLVPYQLPVTIPTDTTAPPVDASAPYTPAVLSLISQLESPTLTLAEIQNATTLLHDGTNATCHAVGPVGGPVGLDASGNPTTTTLAGNATTLSNEVDSTHITVASATGLTAVGTTVYIGSGATAEWGTTAAGSSGTSIVLGPPFSGGGTGLANTHVAGEPVTNNPALTAAGATFPIVKVASVAGFTAGETIWVGNTSDAEQVTIASVGTAGATGTGLTLSAPLAKTHLSNGAVYVTLTTPSITKLCWADAQGINPTGGPSGPGGGAPNGQTLTSSPNEILGDASTFDRNLMNVWGQTEAVEGRELMMTGLFGPQTDLNRLPNWGRGHQTGGEDPYLSGQLVAAQINGIQAKGFMSEMKHFTMYNGQNQNTNTDVQDQAAHELYFTPYENGFVSGRAAATMCSYQIWRDTSTNPLLAEPVSTLTQTSPYAQAGEEPQTWPLNESHFSCEQPLSMSYTLRGLWGSAAMVGTDYPAQHSTSGIMQGMEQEMPTANGFMNGGNGTNDPTGSTCAYTTAATTHTPGDVAPCNDTSDPVSRVGGIPNHFQGSAGTGCPAPTSTTGAGGCTLNAAVQNGVIPISVLNQSLARVLYQEERFGMLGCDPIPTATCKSPGGIGSDRSGNALIPSGPASGASPVSSLGTESGDAAVTELTSEEGSVLFKNDNRDGSGTPALPINPSDLTANNVFVTGPGAEYAIASPSREASQGFPDRLTVNPLQTLANLSGHANAFTYFPALSPTGEPVPAAALSTVSGAAGSGLDRTAGPGSPSTDPQLDLTAVNGNQLASANTLYSWKGCLYVPAGGDNYTLRFQNTPGGTVTLGLGLDPTTTLSRASAVGDTNIKVANVTGFVAGQTITIDTAPNLESAVIATVGTAGNNGTGITLGAPLTGAHASGAVVNGPAGINTSTTSCAAAWATQTGSPTSRSLSNATTFYNGQYQGNVPVTVTNAGYTDAGLQNRQFVVGNLNPAAGTYYPLLITDTTPASPSPASFRFAYSRTNGDIADAVAAEPSTGLAIVFANDQGVAAASGPTSVVAGIGSNYVHLINAVAAKNPNTIVVLQSAYADTVSDWLPNVKAMLETWNSGQEGAVATARLLLGQANPSGHTAMTWPVGQNDDIWGYNQSVPLYPGDTTGTHPERLNGAAGGGTNETEGIFTGYRFFDKEGLAPQFPFGFGLSYTGFSFSKLTVKSAKDGGLDVSVRVTNTGSVPGDEVAQVYLGAPDSPPAGVQFAVRALAQFDRVSLAPGETKAISMHVAPRQLSYWSEATQRWVLATGTRTVYVGDADDLSHLPESTPVTIAAGPSATECSNEAINATTIQGDVNVPSGSWCDLVSVNITGNLTLHSSSGVRVRSSSISGNVKASETSAAGDLASSGQNVICNSTIGNGLTIADSGPNSPWNIGGICGGNTITGGLQFTGNQATSSITDNTIGGGDLKCNGNVALTGSGNTVTGGAKKGQCSGF
jgi:hypothetical protein